MSLQGSDLVMIGRGVDEHRQPHEQFPAVANGTHLRWSFDPAVGFADHGYHLFRREHVGEAIDPETFATYREVIEREATAVGIRSGVKQRPRPYRFDGDDFLQLLGWFAAEGSIYDHPDDDCLSIKIAQETPRHRETIQHLLERLGIDFHQNDRCFRFGSKFYGELFEKLCGNGSRSKRLPQLVWDCSTAQKQLLLDTLLAGDGNTDRTYYTISDELAQQVLRLCVETGTTPGYDRRRDWRVYCRHVDRRFKSHTHCSWVDATRPYYRVVVEDYPLVLVGRSGKFQWLAAGGIA